MMWYRRRKEKRGRRKEEGGSRKPISVCAMYGLTSNERLNDMVPFSASWYMVPGYSVKMLSCLSLRLSVNTSRHTRMFSQSGLHFSNHKWSFDHTSGEGTRGYLIFLTALISIYNIYGTWLRGVLCGHSDTQWCTPSTVRLRNSFQNEEGRKEV